MFNCANEVTQKKGFCKYCLALLLFFFPSLSNTEYFP